MPKIIDYHIQCAASVIQLETAVREWLSSGWQPIGGPVYNSLTNTYSQALVKYEEPRHE